MRSRMSSGQSSDSIRCVFDAAAEIADPEARALFLDAQCAGNGALRARVERLLEADSRAGRFLGDRPESGDPALSSEKPGERIGRYRLRERIGRGGCGVVYLADQEEPVRREVALKVIKLGMDTEAVVARFEAERQALAMMDHPHIARVFDAGATESGRPYFVMELVRGISITEFCTRHSLALRQRLHLFMQACHAVQHAHQKGVIHRDLKPSNILVSGVDGASATKIIDFGIAKATGLGLSGPSFLTNMNQFVGTPAYMSPEQAEFGGRDVDTRSDIYSLGVVLYELLAGGPPFDGEELMRSGVAAMCRTLREREPVKPSAGCLESVETRGFFRELRGDLDWIVMKCLEKDRTRRYATPGELAADLQRYLDHELVTARPPTTFYRLRKVFRRHRVGFVAATVVLVTLLVAVVVSGGMAMRAWRSEAEATAKAAAATTAQRSSEAVSIFLFNVLGPSLKNRNQDPRTITIADQLSEAADELHRQPYPITQRMDLVFAVGRAFWSAKLFREATPFLAEYIAHSTTNAGPLAPNTLKAQSLLAYALMQEGQLEDAQEMYAEVVAGRRQISGDQDSLTQNARLYLAEAASKRGRWHDAVQALEEAWRHETDALKRSDVQHQLAAAYAAARRREEALVTWEALLDRMLRDPSHAHSEILPLREGLASAYLAFGRVDEAVAIWIEASLRNPHDRIRDLRYAALLLWFDRTDEYLAMTARLIAAWKDTRDAGMATCTARLSCLRNLPDEHLRSTALELARRAVDVGRSEEFFLPWHELTLGMAEYRQGHFAAADTAFLQAEQRVEEPSHPHKAWIQGAARFYRAMILVRSGDVEQARLHFNAAEAAMRPAPADQADPTADGADEKDLVLWLAWKEARSMLTSTSP